MHTCIFVYQMDRLCGGAHEISGIPAPLWLCGRWLEVHEVVEWVGVGVSGGGVGGMVGGVVWWGGGVVGSGWMGGEVGR